MAGSSVKEQGLGLSLARPVRSPLASRESSRSPSFLSHELGTFLRGVKDSMGKGLATLFHSCSPGCSLPSAWCPTQQRLTCQRVDEAAGQQGQHGDQGPVREALVAHAAVDGDGSFVTLQGRAASVGLEPAGCENHLGHLESTSVPKHGE